MESLNIQSMAEELSEKHSLTKKESTEIITLIFEMIGKSLEEGNPVEITRFGKFSVKERPSRTGINPRTLETIEIPSRKSPVFQASSVLKKRIR